MATTKSVPARQAVSAGDAAQAVDQTISFRLSLLARVLERRLARLVGGELGLAVAEYRVLVQIVMRPKSAVRDIAERTMIDKAQVSRSATALEMQKLVTRSIPPTDRRSPVFTATRSGKALIRKIAPLRAAEESEILAALTPTAVAELQRALGVVVERLTEPLTDAPEPTAAQRRAELRRKRAE